MLQRCIVVPLNVSSSMMGDGDDMSDPSSPESTSFDDTDLLTQAVHDEVTAQLAAAGPVGVAAAAAIVSGKKRKRPHVFETNPSIRKRQQTRLLRKLKHTLEEYTTRIGQQAIILCCTPGKQLSTQVYKVFGSQPLESIVRNCRGVIMPELESNLAQQAPPQSNDIGQYELPAVCIDGIPTPVDKMTQAQLRAFIPEMLKFSTGRSKPGWGKVEYRPLWWPSDLPWANVRSDVRSEEEKKRVSWTHALRTIVKNCYKHHGREDLMPEFEDVITVGNHGLPFSSPTMDYFQVQTINNADGSVSIIKIETNSNGNAVVTLGDGTQAHVVHTEASTAVQTLADVVHSAGNGDGVGTTVTLPQGTITLPSGTFTVPVTMDMGGDGTQVATLAEATINADGQIVLSGDAQALGGGDGAARFGMVIPVSMYQTVVSSMQSQLSSNDAHLHSMHNGDDSSPYSEVV